MVLGENRSFQGLCNLCWVNGEPPFTAAASSQIVPYFLEHKAEGMPSSQGNHTPPVSEANPED